MNNRKDDLIIRCMANFMLPLALVYGFSVIFHGHISPGGGFQGGVVVAVSVILIFLAYGAEGVRDSFCPHGLHTNEMIGSIAYIIFALLGIYFGFNFCRNVFAHSGEFGAVWSSGTIFLMNLAVGYKVLTGVSLLLFIIIGLLINDFKAEEGEK